MHDQKLKNEINECCEKVVELEDNFIDLAFEMDQLKEWSQPISKIISDT